MAIRQGMVELLNRLRLATETVTNPSDNDNFYTDEQLQEQLDLTAQTFVRSHLYSVPTLIYGGWQYTKFAWSPDIGKDVEQPILGGMPNSFYVQKTTGIPMVYGVDYTIDWTVPVIVFNNDQQGQAFYLSVQSYNFNKAAAEIWLLKAGRRADLYHFRTDNHTMYQDEMWKHCMEMYAKYAGRSGTGYSRLIRVDERRGRYATFKD